MSAVWSMASGGQQERNQALIGSCRYLGRRQESRVLPLSINVRTTPDLGPAEMDALEGLQIEAAEIAVRSVAELGRLGEADHLGGGLELIPALLLTLAVTDYERVAYTIEHAHTSVGYFAALAALGYVDRRDVIAGFRRGLDLPGHVSWLPGGTQLSGGRLGVMVPVAVGQALGKRADHGDEAWVVCHCGDAGWISGQALNGFNIADLHRAPISFVMHRNGIQLSGATASVMDRDPRPIIESLGVEIIEVDTLHDSRALYSAYREGYDLARRGRPNIIFPVGYQSAPGHRIDLAWFGRTYGIMADVEAFAAAHGVAMDRQVWVPGSLMSFRDVEAMIECLFLVNGLPGGKGHHDGHMKGRDTERLVNGPMFRRTSAHDQALASLGHQTPRLVVTSARPEPGTPNLVLPSATLAAAVLPSVGKAESPRAGSEAAYALVARQFPQRVFVVSCDLDASTKLGKARGCLDAAHQFEVSIEEQAATLMANGLAMGGPGPRLCVVSTFAAFFEGIAREGFDMWRYQRNLTGVNEGLNVTFHLSHVGACTGRDHFSGWGLDWINLGLTYLPYLHRFYAPADARAAFVATLDLAAHYGGHVIGIPRDNLPILDRPDGSGPLWEANAEWEPITTYRLAEGARRAILAMGAPAFLAGEAAAELRRLGVPVDVHIVNGLPVRGEVLEGLIGRYPDGVVTVEDGLIGGPDAALAGFAGVVAARARRSHVRTEHIGITDPRVAPSDGHLETWAHFGITTEALVAAVRSLG